MPGIAPSLKGNADDTIRILFVGDIFGKSGRRALKRYLEPIRKKYQLDMVIANGENSAGGIGITSRIAEELFQSGVDVLTSGNHLWKYKDILEYVAKSKRLLRPINYPAAVPGKGFVIFETPTRLRIAVLNLIGRVFMEPLDCPFQAADEFLKRIQLGRDVAAIIVDMHAEATSEKVAMGLYLDGRVSAVLGTHTHIPTSDHRILTHGSGFQTDVGMTGCYNSVIGMKLETVLPRFVHGMPTHFEQMQEKGALCGVVVKLTKESGLCQEIIPIRLGANLSNTGLDTM